MKKEYSWRNRGFKVIEEVERKWNNDEFGGFIVSKNIMKGVFL